MVLVNTLGQKGMAMKVNGKMVFPMGKENLFTQIAQNMLEIGKTAKKMDKGHGPLMMDLNMLGDSKMD